MKEIIKYHYNGEILIKYHVDDNGMKHGLFQLWYYNGQPCTKCHYINGSKHGLYQRWYENGQLWEEYHYINNKFHGLYQRWHDDGELIKEVIYINNEETNLQIPKSRNEKILFKIEHGVEI